MKHQHPQACDVLPFEALNEIHDCLTLALDASETRGEYTRSILEARSHMRAARRQVERLIGGGDA